MEETFDVCTVSKFIADEVALDDGEKLKELGR